MKSMLTADHSRSYYYEYRFEILLSLMLRIGIVYAFGIQSWD